MRTRPSRLLIVAHLVALGGAAVVAVATEQTADWDLPLLFGLLAFSVVSDLTAVRTSIGRTRISGNSVALVVAMAFLGGPPAALIGVATIAVGWIHPGREPYHYLLNNLVAFAWFPLLGGLLFSVVSDAGSLGPSDALFYVLILGVFVLTLVLNVTAVVGYNSYLRREAFLTNARKTFAPILPLELATALLAGGVAYLYHEAGLAAIALVALILLTFQYLVGELLLSQERAEQLERRTTQLASFQLGLMSALLHTLDLRDRMTARHSAAVARYSREIARAAGFSDRDQELVHTAALLHDIGKFVFPDRILKADVPLTDEDWQIIRMHPGEGAQIVSDVEGYGPVGDIVLAHHERFDGTGYPNGVKGEDIPALSRIISVADTYDVLTARDSYRDPVSSFEAIQELRRVAGSHLDPVFVEIFIELLSGTDLRYRHGEDADFDAELGLERRIHDYAFEGEQRPRTGRFQRRAEGTEAEPAEAPARQPG